jgi:hypothetical protein
VRCPYCEADEPRRQLHRHLVDAHGSHVAAVADPAQGTMAYRVVCPACGGEIRQPVKPRWRDPGFLREFEEEIRLVAFDLLLYHLEDAHPDRGT